MTEIEIVKEFIIEGVSDNGTKTEMNQDACFVGKTKVNGKEVVFISVCDGMGGTQQGELASATIIDFIRNWFYSKCDLEDNWKYTKEEIEAEWRAVLDKSNNKILEYSGENKVKLGSTITFFLLYDEQLNIMNIGDTRIYEMCSDTRRLSFDHSVVGKEIMEGRLTEEEAKKDRRNNMLTQCVGMLEKIDPFFASYDVVKNGSYVICSDGFYNKISNQEMREALTDSSITSRELLADSLKRLVGLDRQRGERDDITAVAVVVREKEE